jgi:hypothetical protein
VDDRDQLVLDLLTWVVGRLAGVKARSVRRNGGSALVVTAIVLLALGVSGRPST